MTEYVTILTTIDSEEKAKELSSALVKEQLVACAQRVAINSTFEWEGEVQEDAEYLILLKTNVKNQDAAISLLAQIHTYDEPEIIVLPVIGGSKGYLSWIDQVTK